MNTLRQSWISLTAPQTNDENGARREYMTRVIYVMVSAGLLIMSIIIPVYDFSVGEPDYTGTILMLLADSLMFTGWLLIYRGHWNISRYLLPAIFLALGGYFFYNVGLVTTGVLQLAIAIILTALLFGSKAQWATVVFSVILYLTLGWLAGERDFEVFFTGGIVVGFSLSGVALLQWFSSTLLSASIERLQRAETASRASAEKTRAIFESITDGITITDLQGNITDVNQAVLRMHGFENRDELIGQSAFLLIAERDHATAMENLQLTITRENSGLLEYTLLKKNGEEFDGELNAVLLRDETGNSAGFVALTRDISHRKEAESERDALIVELKGKNIQAETLREITTIVASTLDQTEIVQHILDQLKRVVQYDSASVWLYKGEVAKMIGWINLPPEAFSPGYYTANEKEPDYPLRTDENLDYVLFDDIQEKYPQFREPSLNYIHSWMAIPLRARGKLAGFIALDGYKTGTFTDDDAQMALIFANQVSIALENARLFSDLQNELAERIHAEEKYRSIYNNSIEGIFQSTDGGRFLSVNPAMARMYGYDSPEDMLHSVNDIGTQLYVDSEQRKEVRQRLASEERLVGYESLEYRKDGSTFWSSMSAQAIRDQNGKVLYYEGTIEDITPRKQAEAEREKLIAELQSKNEELERFTYTVSHDLKAPLITVGGFLGYLEEDVRDGNAERIKQDIERINDAIKRMNQLLNELLELSRIGRMMNPPEEVPFEEIVREALAKVQGQLSNSKVKVKVGKGLPIVNGDRIRLVQVVQNLLDNAAKFMGDQPNPRIEIGTREVGNESIFFVKDNGIGIEPQFQDKVFGLFDKLDPNSSGTGIGLALVKRIVDVHGGRIWVESETGKETTFYFTISTSGYQQQEYQEML